MPKEECSSCLRSLNPNTKIIVQTKCNHKFHKICLENWLSYKDCCPMCRSDIYDYEIINKKEKHIPWYKRFCFNLY